MFNLLAIRTILFDMDGVLYRGQTALPGVTALLSFCKQHDIAYGCVTNNATMTPHQYEQKLAAMQIDMPAALIWTSATVTGYYLRTTYPRGTTVYMIGMNGLHEALFHDGYFIAEEHTPRLVVQGADFTITYDKLKLACLAIRAGADYIATNADRTYPTEAGLIPGAGALVAALSAATDIDPLVIGKPQPIMFQVAMEALKGSPSTTLIVGDRLDTDIAGAHMAHMPSALVLTGVSSRTDLATSPYHPDHISDGLPDLLTTWQTVIQTRAFAP